MNRTNKQNKSNNNNKVIYIPVVPADLVPGITGVLMMLILALILVTSASWFRTRHYNTFYYSHHFLFGPFLVLLVFHPTR